MLGTSKPVLMMMMMMMMMMMIIIIIIPAHLFITGGKEIKSAEGTTQGDPIAMGLCS